MLVMLKNTINSFEKKKKKKRILSIVLKKKKKNDDEIKITTHNTNIPSYCEMKKLKKFLRKKRL